MKQSLDMLGIPRTTFDRRYDRYVESGFDARYGKYVVVVNECLWVLNLGFFISLDTYGKLIT